MSGAFKAGDKCIIRPVLPGWPPDEPVLARYVGKTVTLISYLGQMPVHGGWQEDFWFIDAQINGFPCVAAECRLQKLPPPKQQELGNWEECPWSPYRQLQKETV